MDVESKATIDAAISDAQSAIDASAAKAIAALSSVGADLITAAGLHVAAVVKDSLTAGQSFLDAQDGWTLRIGPIVIPEFSIVLEKPKP